MNKRAKSLSIFLGILSLIILSYAVLVSAASFTATVTQTSVNEDISATFNFTIINTNVTANITQVNITVPIASISTETNGTSAIADVLAGNAYFFSWTNTTNQLIINGSTAYFWFLAVYAEPGTINFSVVTLDETGASNAANVTIVVNDTTKPTYNWVNSPTSGTTGETAAINITANDNCPNPNTCLTANITVNSVAYAMQNNGSSTFGYIIAIPAASTASILYNVTIWDGTGNANTTDTKTITVTDNDAPLSVNLIVPTAEYNTTSTTNLFNCTAADVVGLANITLYIWNSTGSIVNQTTTAVSGTSNESAINVALPYDNAYKWNCRAGDGGSNYAFASANRTLTIDTANPLILSAGLLNSDNFFSSYDNIVNVSINVSDLSLLSVAANFSNISTSACGTNGILNLALTNGLWKGNCSIGTFITNTNPQPRIITLAATDAVGHINDTSAIQILVHNMGVPPTPDNPCNRFGNLTTNFTKELNFNSVNFIIQMEMNGSCIVGPGGGSSPWQGFEQVMMMNFSSLNMSSQDIGQKLAGLKDALQVDITPPHIWGPTRVYVNETAFAELNTNTTITLNNLPFTGRPTLISDNASRNASNVGFTSQTPWDLINPAGQHLIVPRGDLTFSVIGFSGYNANDTVKPLITLVSPLTNIKNGTNVVVSAIVNGTGTDLSYILISLNNSLSRSYNGSDYYNSSDPSQNTANCINISVNKETFNCTFLVNLSDGNYNLNVTAWDFGGDAAPGNRNSSSSAFLVDSIAPLAGSPVITPSSPASYLVSPQFNLTWDDGPGVGMSSAWIEFNGTNYTMSGSGNVYNKTFSSLTIGSYAYKFWANDTLNNVNSIGPSGTYNVNSYQSVCSLAFNVTSPQNYSTSINATCSCTNAEVSAKLYRNDADVNTAENGKSKILNAATHPYVCNVSASQNYTAASNTSTFTISPATPTLVLTNYTALTVTYPNVINATGSGCPAQLAAQSLCILYKNDNDTILSGASSDQGTYATGSYEYFYGTAGNENYSATTSSSLTFIVSQASSNLALYINGSRIGKTVPINTVLLLNATLITGSGSIIVTNNGVTIYSGTTPYAGNSTNFTSLGTQTITANYSGNTNYTSDIETWLVSVYDPTYTSNVNSSVTIVNQTQITVNNATLLQNITIPQSSNQTVVLDLVPLINNSNVTIGAINVNVIRTDNSSGVNYTLVIPANTNISGSSGWDGKLTLPIVNSSSFAAPSSGTTNVVIDLGSSVEVNFSNPVKVVLGGQTGKKAAWSRGSTTLTDISTQCTNATVSGITSGECYYDDGTDLIIWTYHFTSYAAYTPYTAPEEEEETPSGGSGGITVTKYSGGALTESGITHDLKSGETLEFTIGSDTHSLTILGISQLSASIRIQSSPVTALISKGETKNFDLNDDGQSDTSVYLQDIYISGNIYVSKFALKSIGAAAGAEQQVTQNVTVTCGNGVIDAGEDCSTCAADVKCAEGQKCENAVCVPTTAAEEVVKTAKLSLYWIVGIIAALLIAAAVIVFLKNKKHHFWKKSHHIEHDHHVDHDHHADHGSIHGTHHPGHTDHTTHHTTHTSH